MNRGLGRSSLLLSHWVVFQNHFHPDLQAKDRWLWALLAEAALDPANPVVFEQNLQMPALH